jgi:hypothetical protein
LAVSAAPDVLAASAASDARAELAVPVASGRLDVLAVSAVSVAPAALAVSVALAVRDAQGNGQVVAIATTLIAAIALILATSTSTMIGAATGMDGAIIRSVRVLPSARLPA